MGNYCGGERKNGDISNIQFMEKLQQSQIQNYKSSSKFYTDLYSSTNNVATLIKTQNQIEKTNPIYHLQKCILQAKEQENIDILLDFIDNDQSLILQIELTHPWAAAPQTIGSLATLYLCTFLIQQNQEDQSQNQRSGHQTDEKFKKYFEHINQKNIITKLLLNLKSNNIDRQELTILLIVFISELETYLNQEQKEAIFQSIIELLQKSSSQKIEFRIASCYILKELFKDCLQFRQQVLEYPAVLNVLNEFLSSEDIHQNLESLKFIILKFFLFQNYLIQILYNLNKNFQKTFFQNYKLIILKTKQKIIYLLNFTSIFDIKFFKNYYEYLALYCLENLIRDEQSEAKVNIHNCRILNKNQIVPKLQSLLKKLNKILGEEKETLEKHDIESFEYQRKFTTQLISKIQYLGQK